jgi:glycosyltransferase involved in cell wall biosynthesis
LVDSFADEDLTNAQMINAREIVRRLHPERFAVTMFFLRTPSPQIANRPNTRLIQLPPRLQTISILKQFVLGDQDIVFYLKPSPASRGFLQLRSMGYKRCDIVATVESQSDWRDDTTTPQTRRMVEKTIFRCRHLFSNSPLVQQSLSAHYGLSSEVVRTGVDTEFFQPNWNRAPNPKPRVLFVGALRNFKGPQFVLDAAGRYPQAEFVLVGDGVLRKQLEARSQSLPNVQMLGSLGRSAIREEFARADIFLFPSRWEGSPRVLMEAACCGLPVVARKEYRPESVIDGHTGFLAADDHEMMVRLQQLLGDSNLRRSMGECGRAHMAGFSWDGITRQWEDIFARLAQERWKGVRP